MKYPKRIPISGRVRVCVEYLRAQTLKGKTILDVGSTFGWLSLELQHDGLKKYIGIEPNKEALQFAKKNGSRAHYLHGDAAHIPVKKSTADIAVFFDVIEHVPFGTEVECLSEIHRILKPNGTLLLSTPFDHPITKLMDPAFYFGHRHYSKEKLTKLLSESGFKLRSFEVRGGVVSLFYMIVFYVAKWLFKMDLNGTALQKMDNTSYNKKGIATVYLAAVAK